MSSPYPILDNRPIDQWKVTELKEELKRRKLKMTGLKDDLIKRLNEAIRSEREALEKEASKDCEPEVEVKVGDAGDIGTEPNHVEMAGDAGFPDGHKTEKVKDVFVDGPSELAQGKFQADTEMGGTGSAPMISESVVSEASMQTSCMVDKTVVSEIASQVKSAENDDIKMENEDSKPPQMDAVPDVSGPNNQVYEVSPVLGFQVESESISTDSVSINEKNELKDNLNADDVNLELEVVKLEMVQPSPTSEVPPRGGNLHPLDDQKPCENQGSIEETDGNKSTQVDFCEKNDSAGGGSPVKLNLNQHTANDSVDDGVVENSQIDSNHNSNEVGDKTEQTEISVVKDESPVHNIVNDMSPEEMETSAEKKNSIAAPAEERNLQGDSKARHLDPSKRNEMSDGGSLEKLILDHSSADDSMEEDALEAKQIDSSHNSGELENKTEMTDVPDSKMGGQVGDVGTDLSSDRVEPSSEKKDNVAAPEKRKFQDGVGINEAPKRQRRWNNESLKIPEPQSSNLIPSTTPKGSFQTARMKHNLSRSDSAVSGDAPKERIVPISPKPATNSLRIDRFLRPFTLKAVQELLAKTGEVRSFWMDHIKTHCYVTYSSVEEAIETRNALYNLQWPPNGGRLLAAEYVDPQEVKLRVDAPPRSPATPVSAGPAVPAAASPSQTPSSTRQHGLKQQLPPPPAQLQPPPISNAPTSRERDRYQQLPPPPPVPEKVEAPIVTLDDLFRKTKATPRIYYLPLSDEQVAAKTKK